MSEGCSVSTCSSRWRRPRAGAGFDGRGVLEGVERLADGGVADGVDQHLPAAAVHHRHDPVQRRDVHLGQPGRRAVGVGLEHQGGVRLDHPVQHQLHRPGLDQRVVGAAPPEGVEAVGVGFGEGRIDRQRVVEAEPELALANQLVVQLELVHVGAGVLRARHPELVCLGDRIANRLQPLVPRRLREDPRHQRLGGFLEHARRLAGGRVADDHAPRGIGGGLGDTGSLQRERVDPGRVAVVAAHAGGPIGDDRVELLPRRQAARERRVVPAAALHPRAVGMCGGEGLDRRGDLVEGGGVEQVRLLQAEPAAQQVQVRVVEAWQDGRAVRVDRLCGTPGETLDLAVRPDPEDRVSPDRERLGNGRRAVGGVDPAIEDDQVDRPGLVVSLRADDEADDEGTRDDCHDDERAQT